MERLHSSRSEHYPSKHVTLSKLYLYSICTTSLSICICILYVLAVRLLSEQQEFFFFVLFFKPAFLLLSVQNSCSDNVRGNSTRVIFLCPCACVCVCVCVSERKRERERERERARERGLKLLVYEASSNECIRPSGTNVWRP